MESAVPQPSPAAKPARRAAGSYDEPTAEKIAFGKRLIEARKIAGMSQAEAAEAMGYSQAVQLSLMESGQRMPTARVLIHCATLYGTTTDFLCGLVDDSDRDPLAAAQREISGRVVGDVRRLIATITGAAATAIRELKPEAGRVARLAQQVIDAAEALARMRQLSAEFDELRGSATLARRVGEALGTAHEHLTHVARAQRVAAAAPVDPIALAGVAMADAADLAELAGRLTRPLQVATGADDEAGDADANDTSGVAP